MSLSSTVLNKKFLAVLSDLGIDTSEFPDKTFDGLFDSPSNDSNYFLEWFCENVSRDNVLTDEERAAYDELKNLNQNFTEEELETRLGDCHPSYEDIKGLDANYVNDALPEELEFLDQEYQDLLNVQHSLELLWKDIKKEENNLLEESHKWKNSLDDAKNDLLVVNSNVNGFLKDVGGFLLESPKTLINLSLSNDKDLDLDMIEECFSADENYLPYDYKNLEERLSTIECCRISSIGKLEEKRAIHSTLEKIVKSKKSKDTHDMLNIYSSPKDANTCEKLKVDISSLEKNELQPAIGNLSNLELSKAFNHFQLNKLYSVKNLITKANSCKDSLEMKEAFNLLLLHILHRSVNNVNNLDDLISFFSENLIKNHIRENDKIEYLNWKKRRYDEVVTGLKDKHPLVMALKEIVPDFLVPKLSSSMELFVKNLSSESLYSSLEARVRKYAAKLLCGPTKQLQFTEIGLMKKFHTCEYLLTQRKNEVKKLTNKYLSFKNAVAQGNRTKLLLWILFLTNPEKLEYVVQNIEKETVLFETKHPLGDTTYF